MNKIRSLLPACTTYASTAKGCGLHLWSQRLLGDFALTNLGWYLVDQKMPRGRKETATML